STSGTAYPHNAPQVINIQTYDDGTTLAYIARFTDLTNNQTQCAVSGMNGTSLEPILLLRVFQLNGTVKEITPRIKIDFVNFCIFNDKLGNPHSPITIYSLYNQFILISYINATNSSDPKTFNEWGAVIDFDGNIQSQIFFGPSYVNYTGNPNGIWSPQSVIQLNVNKKLGFLRFNTRNGVSDWSEWQQYSISNNGKLSMLKSANISITQSTQNGTSSYQSTIISTVDGKYAILNLNTSMITSNNTSSLTTFGGLDARSNLPSEPFPTTPFAANVISNNVNQNSLNAATAFMKKDNTFLLASNYSNEKNNSWSVLTIPLPQFQTDKGYGNRQIDDITPQKKAYVNGLTNSLKITFRNPVILSTGYIYIYKVSDKYYRQKIQGAINDNDIIKLTPDGKTVSVKIISSTFNEYGGTYYVQMDANF
ncbi:3004_t:CDS:2, partial [Scutellospora calospora]